MAWFPASLLKTNQHVQRRCAYGWFMKGDFYATMIKMWHGLATLNSNNSIVYGHKH